MDENVAPERRCPACGASMPAASRFCGACGMDTLPAAESAPAVAAAAPVAATATASDASDAELADGKRCKWCGAQNPREATRCVACDATFPTPEGDEALERAARARIQAMESDLKQPKRGGWWPFRSR